MAAALAVAEVNPLDLITAGVGIVNKLIELHKLDQWAKLIFGFVFTWITSYSLAMGSSLVSGHGFGVSVGVGLISASGAITALFVLNPRTKGIMIAQDKKNLPPVDVSDFQTLEKK